MEYRTNSGRPGRGAHARPTARFPRKSVLRAITVSATATLILAGGCESPLGSSITPPDDIEGDDAWAFQAATLIDEHRATLGCAPLRWHAEAAAVARSYSTQMSDQGFFGHVDPAGTTLKQRLDRAGISGYAGAAEAIAAGQDGPPEVVSAWLKSSGHRAILEDCEYDLIGLGFHDGSGQYREYWTAVFLAEP